MSRLSEAPATFTVGDALREPALAESELVSGAGGLGVPVQAVGVLDVGDLAGVSANQFVLVSAYALLGANVDLLVKQLKSRGAAALGIKIEPYWSEMPEALIHAADETDLPLLRLPPGRFEDLINPLLSTIVDRQAVVLRSMEGLHRDLTRAVLSDDDLGSAARILSEALGREVAIFDEDGEPLIASDGDEASWAQLGDDVVRESNVNQFARDGQTYLVAPISAKGRRYGAICVRGADSADVIAPTAAVEAAVVTGMQLLVGRQMDSVHRRFESEVLDDLIAGRLSGREARIRAERVGWPVRRPYVVLLVARGTGQTAANRRPAELAIAHEDFQAFSRALRFEPLQPRRFRYLGGLGIVVPFPRDDDPKAVARAIVTRLARVRSVSWAQERVIVAASRPSRNIGQLPRAVREARLALELAPAAHVRDQHLWHFDDLGVARLVASASDHNRLVRIAREELAPLFDMDARLSRELVDALGVLLAHNLRLSESAQDLFFHYNTVRNRIARLRELLGPRLETADGQRRLWLAFLALRISELEQVQG